MNNAITAVGAHAPPYVIDNITVAAHAGVEPDLIAETGILERRYTEPGTPTSELAADAVHDLLQRTPDALARVGTVVVATSTPDSPQPATAARLHLQLGLPAKVAAFDINAACSGFLLGLRVADGLAGRDPERPDVLLVGADQYSTIIDRSDWRTAALLGDGAGAVIVSPSTDGLALVAWRSLTHSNHVGFARVDGDGTREPPSEGDIVAGRDRFRMEGPAGREYAEKHVGDVVAAVLSDASIGVDNVHRWIFHQANTRLVRSLTAQLGIDPARVPLTCPTFGNTGAASIPLTLAVAVAEQPLQPGEVVVFVSIDGGMSAAAALAIQL